LAPISDRRAADLMLLLDSASRYAAHDVVRNITYMKLRLICWNHEPCLIHVEAEHAEAHTFLRHHHLKPSFRLASTHQGICEQHL
jgi:hypothetical protein